MQTLKNELIYNYLPFFFLDCEDCNADHFGDCPIHGPLLWIKDTEVHFLNLSPLS